LQAGVAPNLAAAFVGIVKTRGVLGLYTGLVSTILREVPFDMIEFSIYETIKRSRVDKETPGPLATALTGAFAGGVAAGLTNPLDLIKTRLMTEENMTKSRRSVVQVFQQVWREEGPLAFFKGVVPRVMWISFGGCVFFSAYEAARSLITRSIVAPAK